MIPDPTFLSGINSQDPPREPTKSHNFLDVALNENTLHQPILRLTVDLYGAKGLHLYVLRSSIQGYINLLYTQRFHY